MGNPTGQHAWRFFRAGGVDQATVTRGEDLQALANLDLKTWVALACPVKGLEFDEKTLALLDVDGDGRIRAPEVITATTWAAGLLRNPDLLVQGRDTLALADLDDRSDEGAGILASARRILASHGRPEAQEISLAEVLEARAVLAKAVFNGDGVVPPGLIRDPLLQAVASDAITCIGGVDDVAGTKGLDQAGLEGFFAALEAFAAWHARGKEPAALPLGERTAAAAEAIRAVRSKVDDYFTRCRLAAFDARATAALNRVEDDWKAMAAQELSPGAAEIAAFPLSRIEPDRPLPLTTGVNPAWVEALLALRDKAVAPILGRAPEQLSADEWATLKQTVAAHEAWRESKAGGAVEPLGLARVQEILDSQARAGLSSLIEQDLAVEPEVKQIVGVERLLRYVRDLHRLVNNFVSFTEFYGRKKAVFQAGTLFIDGRACDLCLKVHEPARHATLAGLAKMYLLYCDCTRPSGEKMAVVAAVTNGDADNLMVGRNGVFYDRSGRDWDATITKIVENPISLREAFFAPYKKFVRMVEEQVAKRAAAADAASNAKLGAAAEATASADKAKPPAEPKKIEIGTVAALGVAVGGITAALGALLQAFFGLGLWMPLGVVGLVLLISGPSMLIAWLKLRKRNIGPLLDASGWAVNALARINIPFGAALTTLGRLPAGAQRTLDDPFAEKSSAWPRVALAAVLLAALAGGLHTTGHLGRWLGYAKPDAAAEGLAQQTPAAAGQAAAPAVAAPAVTAPLPAPAQAVATPAAPAPAPAVAAPTPAPAAPAAPAAPTATADVPTAPK